ncbi:MAG: hypothetical protein HY092_03360 [Candidatus Kerfeldbacteria bacterium]|nr:hypothetical protein [Candidatus Kerfeldbacteria bacterium]
MHWYLQLTIVTGLTGAALAAVWEAVYHSRPKHLVVKGWHLHHSIYGLLTVPAGVILGYRHIHVWDTLIVALGSGLLVAYAAFNNWRLPVIDRD